MHGTERYRIKLSLIPISHEAKASHENEILNRKTNVTRSALVETNLKSCLIIDMDAL